TTGMVVQCPLVNKNNETKLLEFIVVNVECSPILGLQASIDLNLITYHINMVSDSEPLINKYTDAIKHEFKDLFDGKLASISGTVLITLDSNAKPARLIPFGLIDDVKAELARMVTDGVIEPITKPTKWVHNIVIVRRENNKIRLCLDPRDLNKYIIRARFQLPTFDEVKSRLKYAKFFVVLDASNGFWMLNLDEASSELLTFITPFGRLLLKEWLLEWPVLLKNFAESFAKCLKMLKLRQFLIGRRIEVHTDHRPLETLFKRPLNKVPPRLQRMKLAVQGFDLHVVYKPEKELFIADALSRAFVDEPVEKEFSTLNEEVICQVNALIENLPIADRILDKIKNETCKDTELIELKKYITAGWPDNKNKLNQIINPYWTYKKLHIIDEIVFKNTSVVVPKLLRKSLINILHEGHVGLHTAKLRARNKIFWPDIVSDIENVTSNCSACLFYQPSNCKEPLKWHEIPKLYLNGIKINFESQTSINACKSIFARHGIPVVVVTDAGTQFSSEKFKDFASNYGFTHITASAKWSQCNGQSESAVKIFVRHQDTVKKYYDKRTRSLQPLREGQNIRFQKHQSGHWYAGKVKGKGPQPLMINPSPRQRSPTPVTPPTNSTLEFPQPVQIHQQIGDSTLQETAERKAVKNLDNKITRSGRVVRNPKKLFDD
ncbi:hypothetical protein ILUMI_15168, partial [Ignelater luminosus]